MQIYKGKDFSDVYKQSLISLFNNPQYETSPRGLKIKENTDVALVIENPLSSIYKNEVRSSQYKYISAELLWYFIGDNSISFIKKYAKFWETIQNLDGTANSSYGNLIFTRKNGFGYSQYAWAFSSLFSDKDSRQAILHFNLPEHQYTGNKDFVCTMYAIFQIRDNKLNLTVTMRSNDAIWGTPTDVAFFSVLQSQMLKHLQFKYPELELGTYTHICNSYHLYEHHFEIVEKMLEKEFIADEIPAVSENLIEVDGRPSEYLDSYFNNLKLKYESPIEDNLFKWINQNLK